MNAIEAPKIHLLMSSYSHRPSLDAFSPAVALMYTTTPTKDKMYLTNLFIQLIIPWAL